MATHGNMETFDPERGDDWPMYTEWMEQYFAANAIESEAKKGAVLLTCIGPKAYGLLWNLLAPMKLSATKYTMLNKTMKEHLSLKPIVITECFKFHKRNQQDRESVAQYLAAKQNC